MNFKGKETNQELKELYNKNIIYTNEIAKLYDDQNNKIINIDTVAKPAKSSNISSNISNNNSQCIAENDIKDLLKCPKKLSYIDEFKSNNKANNFIEYSSELNKKINETLTEIKNLDKQYDIIKNLELQDLVTFKTTDYFKKNEDYGTWIKSIEKSINLYNQNVKKSISLDPNVKKFTNKSYVNNNLYPDLKQLPGIVLPIIKKSLLGLLVEYKKLQCENIRLNKLQYNCKLRRNEGYMINRSLADMRKDILSLIKKSLALGETNNLPIFYEKEIFPYCRNINIQDNYLNEFYDTNNTNLSGELLKIMATNFKIDMGKINFVIFTVFNVTDNGKVNNPPNPPYININDLIYYKDILPDLDKLKKALKETIIETKNYSFYEQNTNMETVYNFERNIDTYNITQLKGKVDILLKIIQQNNPSTLIGSLESTEILQNIVYSKLICSYNENLNSNLDKIKGFKLEQYIDTQFEINDVNKSIDSNDELSSKQSNQYKQKYLKYKEKYLELKAKSKL